MTVKAEIEGFSQFFHRETPAQLSVKNVLLRGLRFCAQKVTNQSPNLVSSDMDLSPKLYYKDNREEKVPSRFGD